MVPVMQGSGGALGYFVPSPGSLAVSVLPYRLNTHLVLLSTVPVRGGLTVSNLLSKAHESWD
jgi:hypothetical protein